ncbi:PepSY-associated TM helix domain-containing protein [Bosea caraganae]|nr:PepSY domain-containing protein [Bosea caraganae]
MTMTTISLAETAPARASASFYRAVWRWHFYAGLLTLPFLILLAVTGGLYLFRYELDGLIHRDLKQVEIRTSAMAAPSAIVANALAAIPGQAVKFVPPETPSASAEVTIRTADGTRKVAYVDPYDGHVLGQLPDKGTVMWVVRQIHSLAYFGPVANGVIEIVGGWAILLVATGLYLWWPRGRSGGVVSVRGDAGKRVFWRDLHAVTGAFAGLFVVFLAVTGMPWSVFWGDQVNRWANGNNFGYPAGVRVAVPMSDEHLHHAGPTSWSLEQARVPESVAKAAAPIGLDTAVAKFDALGLTRGYAVNLPSGPAGVYTGSVYPNDLSRQRVIHLDQYSGEPLIDMSFADYGPLGKALEWGINVHMGQEFGLANQLFMLAVCLAIILLAVSAGVMWWKRRPAGSLGVPPMPPRRRTLYGVFAILGIGGVIFPLVGASLLAMLALDRLFWPMAKA